MTNINIDVPPELHTKLKLKAIREEKTIEEVLTEILQRRAKK